MRFNKYILCNVIRRMRVSGNDVSIIPYVLSIGFHKLPYIRYVQLCRKLAAAFPSSFFSSPLTQTDYIIRVKVPKLGRSILL